jgi:hypothetical protein
MQMSEKKKVARPKLAYARREDRYLCFKNLFGEQQLFNKL